MTGVQFPARSRDFSLLHSVQTGSQANPTSYSMGNREGGNQIKMVRLVVHTIYMENITDAYRNLGRKPGGKIALRRLTCSRQQYIAKVHLEETGFTDVHWINLVQNGI